MNSIMRDMSGPRPLRCRIGMEGIGMEGIGKFT